MKPKTKIVYVRLVEQVHERAHSASDVEGCTTAEIVRRALIEYLDKHHPLLQTPKGARTKEVAK